MAERLGGVMRWIENNEARIEQARGELRAP